MRIYKVTMQFALSRPVFFVVDSLIDLPTLISKHYPESATQEIELISTDVVNMWAQ